MTALYSSILVLAIPQFVPIKSAMHPHIIASNSFIFQFKHSLHQYVIASNPFIFNVNSLYTCILFLAIISCFKLA